MAPGWRAQKESESYVPSFYFGLFLKEKNNLIYIYFFTE
jgi:hypothetical protein